MANEASFLITFNTNPFPLYISHTVVIAFDCKMGFVDELLPVENGKISQKWPKMGFSTGINSSCNDSTGSSL